MTGERAIHVSGAAEGDPRDPRADVHVLALDGDDGRELVLVGTAHVSQESVDLVREVIAQEQPDAVCVELDERRHQALSQGERWQALDLRQVVRNKQLATLLVNLVLASYQRRLGDKLGVLPGSELLEAIRAARASEIPVSLCDRDIRITLRRAWGSVPLWRKPWLLATVVASAFSSPDLSEDDLREFRRKDVMSALMAEFGDAMPSLKRVLIDERDLYLARKIHATPGRRLVAVVGAGHVDGMLEALRAPADVDLAGLETIPPVSAAWRWLGWSIPTVIVGSIVYIGATRGGAAAGENAWFWFLANAIPTALGSIVAFAHPLTVVTTALAAPFTSLTPVIGAGYVGAFVQAWMRPPRVLEFGGVGDDVGTLRGWWRSRLLRVFLVFLLTTLGSAIGTWVGGVEIVSTLLAG